MNLHDNFIVKNSKFTLFPHVFPTQYLYKPFVARFAEQRGYYHKLSIK